ncbi:unnamed protein product [Moneuplotes crassus]|uniref:Uncharacterized protein n=1 Tax=Euplotes crassus TaxID=5936 RepID=A0AAD1UDZ5_EUPCR|nr:unnamed protein product [Moneuplotes crassus]
MEIKSHKGGMEDGPNPGLSLINSLATAASLKNVRMLISGDTDRPKTDKGRTDCWVNFGDKSTLTRRPDKVDRRLSNYAKPFSTLRSKGLSPTKQRVLGIKDGNFHELFQEVVRFQVPSVEDEKRKKYFVDEDSKEEDTKSDRDEYLNKMLNNLKETNAGANLDKESDNKSESSMKRLDTPAESGISSVSGDQEKPMEKLDIFSMSSKKKIKLKKGLTLKKRDSMKSNNEQRLNMTIDDRDRKNELLQEAMKLRAAYSPEVKRSSRRSSRRSRRNSQGKHSKSLMKIVTQDDRSNDYYLPTIKKDSEKRAISSYIGKFSRILVKHTRPKALSKYRQSKKKIAASLSSDRVSKTDQEVRENSIDYFINNSKHKLKNKFMSSLAKNGISPLKGKNSTTKVLLGASSKLNGSSRKFMLGRNDEDGFVLPKI